MLGHKMSLYKFKKSDVIQIILDHNDMKLEINYNKFQKYSATWRLNSMFLNNE